MQPGINRSWPLPTSWNQLNCPADLHYWDGRHHWFKAIYVNQTHNTSELQWWEAELPAIRAREHTYLKRRLRAFSGDHEDLLNITLFDLAKHVRKFERVHPASWFQTSPPEDASEVARYHALAHKILRRRIILRPATFCMESVCCRQVR